MKGRPNSHLILASASPRRLDLLRQIGIAPEEIYKSNLDETPVPKETARQLVKRLANSKAMAGALSLIHI